MEPGVVAQLGMERGHEHRALAAQDGVAVDLGEHLDVGAGALDERRTDEDGRGTARRRRRCRSTARSASKLSTWRPKALRRTVMSTAPKQRWSARPSRTSRPEQDHPGAGAERRHAVGEALGERLEQPG